MESNPPVSEQTLKRLPRYLSYLKELESLRVSDVSATKIAEATDVQHTQVRKDLAVTGVVGVPKVGHKVKDLIKAIENYLGWNNTAEAFLVGFGNLGRAICGYEGFRQYGIKIIAGFDADPKIIGKKIAGLEVLDIKKLGNLIKRMHIKIIIITAPAEFAQELVDIAVDAGVLAIWNFAPIQLVVPEHVIVERTDIYSNLAILSRKLKEKLDQ